MREVRDNGKVMDDGNVISQLATYSEIIGNSDEEGGTFLFYIYAETGTYIRWTVRLLIWTSNSP